MSKVSNLPGYLRVFQYEILKLKNLNYVKLISESLWYHRV